MITKKTSQILQTPENANFSLGEFYCKHCCIVFKSKYTFKRHLESCQHVTGGFVPARAVLAQFNKWCDLMQTEPGLCPSCLKVFTSRQAKCRHVNHCNGLVEDSDRKAWLDNKNKIQEAFDLLVGKLPDRAFSIDYTYNDIKHILDECTLYEAILGQNLSVIIQELYLNSTRDGIFDVVRYDVSSDSFFVFEYTAWECLPRETVIEMLFDKSLLIINSFRVINSVEFQQMYNEYPFKVDLKLWIDDLNECNEQQTGDNIVKRIQKDKIRNLLLNYDATTISNRR